MMGKSLWPQLSDIRAPRIVAWHPEAVHLATKGRFAVSHRMQPRRRARRKFQARGQGQVAVEAALTMPLAIFCILGLMQLFQVYEARFLTEYAAFRATRAGSLGRLSCKPMLTSALEVLAPTMGRADSSKLLKSLFENARTNQYPDLWRKQGRPVPPGNPVIVEIAINRAHLGKAVTPGWEFDTPVTAAGDIAHLSVEMTYWYELRTPFANRLLHEMWELTKYGAGVDTLMPARLKAPHSGEVGIHSENDVLKAADAGAASHYLLPIRASWSLRVMSNPDARDGASVLSAPGGICNDGV